jgi:hypothetical protein
MREPRHPTTLLASKVCQRDIFTSAMTVKNIPSGCNVVQSVHIRFGGNYCFHIQGIRVTLARNRKEESGTSANVKPGWDTGLDTNPERINKNKRTFKLEDGVNMCLRNVGEIQQEKKSASCLYPVAYFLSSHKNSLKNSDVLWLCCGM